MRLLPKTLRVPAPSVPLRGRRRNPSRVGAPRTIIPADEGFEPTDPFASRVDAARERLRRAIPPVSDEE